MNYIRFFPVWTAKHPGLMNESANENMFLPARRNGRKSTFEVMMKTSDQSVYQFKVTLRDISPPIWRRLQVPGGYTLAQLHRVLQIVMGWENQHEYEFQVAGKQYRIPHREDEARTLDARRTRICDIWLVAGAESEYLYDFGDYWQHLLQLESVSELDPIAAYPRCADGARNCPPEDVGGSGGYEDYLAAMAAPEHEAHDEMMSWRGPFDPEAFSVEKVNEQLEKKFRFPRKVAAP